METRHRIQKLIAASGFLTNTHPPANSKYRLTGQTPSNAWCATNYIELGHYAAWYGLENPYCNSAKFEPRFGNSGYYSKGGQYFRSSRDMISLDQPYYDEIAVTAKALIDNNIILSLLIKSDANANTAGPISQWNSNNDYWNATHTTTASKADVSKGGDMISFSLATVLTWMRSLLG